MALHINKLKDFEEKLHTDPIRITKTKDIVSNIMATLNEIPVTERTVYKKLSQFKNSIYYCSSNLGNPMFLSNACNTLNLTEEVVYIYERMFAFLYGNGFLNFERLETLYSKYKPNSFSWNIPEIFLPIAISYILAVTSFKKCDSPKKFFDKMDDYFKSFKNTPQITKEIYKDWTDLYLGREYFCHLENIYETFTKTAPAADEARRRHGHTAYPRRHRQIMDAQIIDNTLGGVPWIQNRVSLARRLDGRILATVRT